MKKHLISTSAIALGVAMAAPVAAQEWDVSFGGYMNQHVGFADVYGNANAGEDYDGVSYNSNSEIFFTPSITLDNGLTFGVTIELEGNNDGNMIDESYMTISSDTLGQIIIGSENSAGYKMMVAAPTVTSMAINSPSISTFIPFSNAYNATSEVGFRQAALSSYTEVAGNNDVQRLTYITPSFNGLTLGVSYASTASPAQNAGAVNAGAVDRNVNLSDIWDLGVNYTQTFGTTTVALAARYGIGNSHLAGVSDPETWGVGAQIGFSDFTIGAAYAENDNGSAGGIGGGGTYGADSEGWNLGVTYDAPGPWAFEAVTYQGEYKTAGNKAKYEAYRIGANRDMGPGVSWDVYVAHVDSHDGDPSGTGRLKSGGTVLGTGINLSF